MTIVEEKVIASSLPGEVKSTVAELPPPELPTLGEVLTNLSQRLENIEKREEHRDKKLSEFMEKLQRAAEAGPPPQTQLSTAAAPGGGNQMLSLASQFLLGGEGGGSADAEFAQVGRDMYMMFMQSFTRKFAREMGLPSHATIESK